MSVNRDDLVRLKSRPMRKECCWLYRKSKTQRLRGARMLREAGLIARKRLSAMAMMATVRPGAITSAGRVIAGMANRAEGER